MNAQYLKQMNKKPNKIMTKELLDIPGEHFITDFHWAQWVAIILASNRLKMTLHCNANRITVLDSHVAKTDKLKLKRIF